MAVLFLGTEGLGSGRKVGSAGLSLPTLMAPIPEQLPEATFGTCSERIKGLVQFPMLRVSHSSRARSRTISLLLFR
jgi:hypothetical protein